MLTTVWCSESKRSMTLVIPSRRLASSAVTSSKSAQLSQPKRDTEVDLLVDTGIEYSTS